MINALNFQHNVILSCYFTYQEISQLVMLENHLVFRLLPGFGSQYQPTVRNTEEPGFVQKITPPAQGFNHCGIALIR